MDGGYQDHGNHDDRRGRRPNRRNATDIGSTYAYWMQNRRSRGCANRGFEAERPHSSYIVDMLPPAATRGSPVDTLPAKHLHTSLNKVKHPVNVVKWTPEGRRLLTGSTSGEFTLWNGTGFNFETIMQAHDSAVRAIKYSHNDDWLISADQDGIVKYWQTNFNNLMEIHAHSDPVRDLAFAPTDSKFVTASDDTTLKTWDFSSGKELETLTGHQWDVKTVDWHPSKGLLVSGSKDHQVKLWDPRNGQCLTTLHGHKNTVAMAKFEPSNGVLLATCAREQNARVFDIRMMRDVFLIKGHDKEITSLVWHPIHSSLLTTGGVDGSMCHHLLDEQHALPGTEMTLSPYDSENPADAPAQTLQPAHRVGHAHDFAIWSMDWHPLGHILASGSNDKTASFWTRPRPGDVTYLSDRWHIGKDAAEAQGTWRKAEALRQREEEEAEQQDEMDGFVDQKMPIKAQLGLPGLPGLPGLTAQMPIQDSISTGSVPPFGFPSNGNGVAPPFPTLPNGQIPGLPPGMDLEALKAAFGGQLPIPPPPPPNGMPFPGMPPGGFQPIPQGAAYLGLPGIGGAPPMPPAANGGIGWERKRGPLPSQEESLQQEMSRGRYTKPR